jgi:hypothetical protein
MSEPDTIVAPTATELGIQQGRAREFNSFTLDELRETLVRPHRIFEMVLGNRERMMKTVVERKNLPILVALLLIAGLVTALPYGLAPPVSSAWKIAALFIGSTLICFPSLFVFGQYLGLRLSLSQTLVWFIAATTTNTSASASTLSGILLSVALFLGIGHLLATRHLTSTGGLVILLAWAVLLCFITYRMAVTIGVAP